MVAPRLVGDPICGLACSAAVVGGGSAVCSVSRADSVWTTTHAPLQAPPRPRSRGPTVEDSGLDADRPPRTVCGRARWSWLRRRRAATRAAASPACRSDSRTNVAAAARWERASWIAMRCCQHFPAIRIRLAMQARPRFLWGASSRKIGTTIACQQRFRFQVKGSGIRFRSDAGRRTPIWR